MGWYVMPEKDSEFAPCPEPCRHVDCAKTREDVKALCPRCGEPIGYGGRIYFLADAIVHASCEEALIELPLAREQHSA